MLKETTCQREQMAAYVDGELEPSAQQDFEQHIAECESCRSDLRAHRMFLCELDAVLTQEPDLTARSDFARVIVAHAESDMRGMRSRVEHKRALRLILILAIAAFSLLGVAASEVVIGAARVLVANVLGLAGLFWKATYDATASAVVISKVLSRKFVVESGSLGLLVVFLGLAVLLLLRLIASYHRARAVD